MNRTVLLQKQEEEYAISPILAFERDGIENVNHIGERHEPDFLLEYKGKSVGLEVVTLHPYQNNDYNTPKQVENFISGYIHKYLQDRGYEGFSCINIALGSKLLFSSGKLKNNTEVTTAIENAINGNVNPDFFVEFRFVDLSKGVEMEKEYIQKLTDLEALSGQKSPVISFCNPGGIQIPINEEDINKALSLKEKKYNRYTSYEGQQFDEVWLCMALPDEEYGFTIKGAPVPTINSKFDRIYLSQTIFPFARLIHCNETNNL